MINSLRTWLLLSFAITIFFIVTGAWLFQNAVKESRDLDIFHFNLKSIRILLLESYKIREDIFIGDHSQPGLYTTRLSAPEMRFREVDRQTNKLIHQLKNSRFSNEFNLQKEIAEIQILVRDYNTNYKSLLHLLKLKGFKNYGLEGRMREYAHTVYEFNNMQVKLHCLMLRRHEKDFLLRKEMQYVHKFNMEVQRLLETIFQLPNPSAEKNKLITNIYYYNKYFRMLSKIEGRIGVNGQNGLLGKGHRIFDAIAKQIQLADDRITEIKESKHEEMQKKTLLAIITLTVLLAVIFISIVRMISRSVKQISDAFSHYVNSNFQFDSIKFKRTRIREFNNIYMSFLKMAKEINIFTNFFREKVLERTRAINDQKDEILGQQLKIENQNLSLLKKNQMLVEQKLQLTVQKKEIKESFRYARRIQRAIQPRKIALKNYFPESFIYYKAKDIVSGDFFLLFKLDRESGFEKNATVIIAADCTGHGVPGAMMSVLGINIINKIINEIKLTCPGEILEVLNDNIVEVLSSNKHGKDLLTDGMDIAVFCFNEDSSQLEYSIARFPHFLIRGGEQVKLEASRNSIGFTHLENKQKKFLTSHINIEQGDQLYLFSDGLPDQFGGAKNKKFKKANILKLIKKIGPLPMKSQKEFFKSELNIWQADQVQTDDILLMGIKF